MQERQSRIIVVLAALFAIVALFYAYSGPSTQDSASSFADGIWQLDPGTVETLTLSEGGTTVALQRELGQWQFVDPQQGSAHIGVIMELLDTLARLQSSVLMNDAERSEFGFVEGQNKTVSVAASDGEYVLVIGAQSPTGQETYVHTGGPQLFAVQGDLSAAVTVEVDFFRDRHLLAFDLAQVRTVVVEGPQGRLRLDGRGPVWWLEGYARADVDAVEDLLVAMLGLKVEQFLPLQEGDELQSPVIAVNIELDGGVTHTLQVGRSTPLGTLVRAGTQQGFVLPATLSFLEQGPVGLVSRRLLPVAAEEVVGFQLTLGAREWLVEQGSHPAALLAAAAKTLVALSVTYRDEPLPNFGEPAGMMTVLGEEGELGVFELGGLVDKQHRMVRDLTGGQPFLLVEAEFLAFLDALSGTENNDE